MRRFLLGLSLSAVLVLQTGCSGSGSGGSESGGSQTPQTNPVPAVSAVSPASVIAGAASQTLTVTGSGFINSSAIFFSGTPLPTTFVSATSLQAQVPASALAAGASASVTVTNPAPGGGTSPTTAFAVMSPTPVISSISPAATPQGAPSTLTVSGSGFEANSVVKFNGAAKPTAFFNSGTLTVLLSATDVPAAGTAQIVVSNPGPGGSDTQPSPQVIYGPPTVTALSPTSLQAGGPATILTVTGTNFASNSAVLLDGSTLATTFVSATTLTAQVPAAALANARNASVTVQNINPVQVVSAATSLPINSPTPVVTSFAPTFFVQGASSGVLTLTGTGFIANSTISWNGTALTTTYVSPTTLRATLPAASLASSGSGQVAVSNPAPHAGTSAALSVPVLAPPVISSINPTYLQVPAAGSAPTTINITVTGTNFASGARVSLAGIFLTTISQTSTQIVAAVSSQSLYQTGATQVEVLNPFPNSTNSFLSSLPATINVINPLATFYLTPSSAPLGSPDTNITVNGSGFFADSVVQWNGMPLATKYVSSNSLTAVIPAADLAVPGGGTISVATPENMGLATSTLPFNTYLALPINALAFNGRDGLLYATTAGTGGPGIGNSLLAIDPVTGVVQRTIFVGSEPTRLVLSTDGTQAFVGLNGAGAVRQVDLTTGTAGVQFSLGGNQGIYNSPYTAAGLAALPGQPNSVAVYDTSGLVTIFDSGVARPKTSSGLFSYFSSNSGALTFGSSASTLYLATNAAGSYFYQLTVDSTGITGSQQLASSAVGSTLQYDNGRLYTPNGLVTDPATGATLGQFSVASSYSSTPVPATGPIFSDSSLNRAFIVANSSYGSTAQVIGYDETTFLPVSMAMVSGIGAVSGGITSSTTPTDLVRWGQDGLAFHTSTQLFLLHGTNVKDTSSTPADLQVTLQLPSTVTTGTAFTYQVQVKNLGASTANGIVLGTSMPASLLFGSATVSQGLCNGAGVLFCDLGSLANGATATLTVTATPSTSGTDQVSATVDSQTFDPAASNNMAVATTTASGSLYAAAPTVSSLSPNAIATGSSAIALTVNGTGFNSGSVILWNGSPLSTSLVSSTQLQATLDDSLLKQLGWASVSVSNPAPGGGISGNLTVSLYHLLSIPANALVYDPYTRKLVGVLPSSSTTPAGNSIVSIDPLTGTPGPAVAVGSEPNLLVESSGGSFFYIGLSGAHSLARFNSGSNTVDATVPLVSTGYSAGPVAASALAALPGLENSVAVDNLGIFDFTGTTATERPNSALNANNAVFPDSTHVYQASASELDRATVDSNGVRFVDRTSLLGLGSYGTSLVLDRGLLFGSGGGIVDPTTTAPTQLGVLPLGLGSAGFSLYGGGQLPYQATAKSFLLGYNLAGVESVSIERFDTQHFLLEDSIQLPANNSINLTVPAVRWGQDGMALLLTGGGSGTSSPPTQIMLLRGAFVLPAEASANPAPTVSAAGNGTITAGSGNQILTVTGTGFIAGASVLWNGTPYTTTFVDAQHLTVAVGAADIGTAGTVNIACQNPGSAVSNTVTLTVH